MTEKLWPPPGFPLVEGEYALTADWSMYIPEKFTRRIEEGSLVLWRPGLTIWMEAWNNDNNESQAERLAWIKDSASAKRFSEKDHADNNVTRFSYRLRDENEDGTVESLYSFTINNNGHLQMAIYFDDLSEERTVHELAESVKERILA
jgi:cytidylate kinase